MIHTCKFHNQVKDWYDTNSVSRIFFINIQLVVCNKGLRILILHSILRVYKHYNKSFKFLKFLTIIIKIVFHDPKIEVMMTYIQNSIQFICQNIQLKNHLSYCKIIIINKKNYHLKLLKRSQVIKNKKIKTEIQ